MIHRPGFRAFLADPGLTGLYDLWDRLQRTLGRLPFRREIDPLDLPPSALPAMLVLEREPSGRYRCRLAGTLLTETYGFEPTGWYLDEVVPAAAAVPRLRLYERVLEQRRPAFGRFRFAIPGREFIASDRLYVPALADGTGDPTVLFSAQRFLYASEVTGTPDPDGVYEIHYDSPADP